MLSRSKYLCQIAVTGLIALQSIALAQQLSMAKLREQIVSRGTVSGEFVQCIRQGTTITSGNGSFTYEPDRRIALNFAHPNRYSVELIYKGGQIKTITNGIEKRPSEQNPLSGLMFSIMNMKASVLDRRFKVDLRGSTDEFSMLLTPKRRLARLLNSVKLAGSGGMLKSIQIRARDKRIITISLFPPGQFLAATCE